MKQPVTPEILKQAGFVPDDTVEPIELGGEGFVAENCRVTFRLNGSEAAVAIGLATGSNVTLKIDIEATPAPPRTLN